MNRLALGQKIITTGVALFLVLFSTVASANHEKVISMTLPEAVAFALHHNSTIESAYLQRVLDKFTLELAKDNYRIQPSFSFDTVTSSLPKAFKMPGERQYGVTPGMTWNTPYSTQFAFEWSNTLSNGYYGDAESLTVTQPLLKGFGKRIASAPLNDALDAEIQAKLTLRQTLISTITSVINDYLALEQTQMTIKNSYHTLFKNKQHLQQDELKVRAGELAPTELAQDKYQVAQQRVQIGDTENSIKSARVKLENDLGLDNTITLKLPTQVDVPHVVPNKSMSEKIALANNISYQEDLLSIKQSKRSLLEARDNARWDLNMTATAARSSTHFSGGGESDSGLPLPPSSNTVVNDNQVGLSLLMPIGEQRLQNKQSIASARLAVRNNQIKLRQDKMSLLNQIDDQIERIKEGEINIKLAKQALALQAETLEVTREKVKYGMSSNFELFSQQDAYTQANQAVVNNKISYLNDLASFDEQLGTTLDTWHVKVKY
jgi:outer membrane protein TolC